MNESKRLKINKRDKQALFELNYQKDMTIQQAFQLEKIKNQALKQKNQKLQVKCKFLYDKIYQENPNPKSGEIFNHLNEDIFELDSKIKQLEEQLYFRYSKQMSKLKKKIRNFFHLINFQIDEQDLEQISDQIDLILLIMEVFKEKYDELTSENVETFQLIQKLREPQQISGTAERIKQLEEEINQYVRENSHLKDMAKDYERQLMYCKKSFEEQKTVEVHKQNGQIVQTNNVNQKLNKRINELQTQKSMKELQIQKRNKRIADLQNEAQLANKKAKSTLDQLERFKKEENKWKERYILMEQQKNQRIKLLQLEINRRMGIQNVQDSTIGYSPR